MSANKIVSDIKVDQINEFITFYGKSLSPSSVRLIRLDIHRFYMWYSANVDANIVGDIAGVLNQYDIFLSTSGNTQQKNRKLGSVRRFLNWLTDINRDQTSLEKAEVKVESVARISAIYDTLFRQHFTHYLLLFFIFVVGLVLMFSSYFNLPHKSMSSKLPRFTLYIPVISKEAMQGLRMQNIKINIFNRINSKNPVAILNCNGREYSSDSKYYIFIDSEHVCNVSYATETAVLANLSEIYIDIIVNTSKINDQRLVLNSDIYPKVSFSSAESQKELNNIVSNDVGYLTELRKNLINKNIVASDGAMLKPNTNISIDLDEDITTYFEDGDIVTLSSGNISQAVLNSPVAGIINTNEIVISGVVDVKVSSKSAEIKPGDTLAVGIDPGTAVRATLGYENIIGMSLESWPNELNKVKLFINK